MSVTPNTALPVAATKNDSEKQDEVSQEKSTVSTTRTPSLLDACVMMRSAVDDFQGLSQRAEGIALNAAIEGARLKLKLNAFEVVAEQIHNQALSNSDLSRKLLELVKNLEQVALHATSVRYYELAEDLIDKLDRNLFERNCDCQAWATFEAIVEAASSTSSWDSSQVLSEHQSNSRIQAANDLLEKLMTTYVVYSDIFLTNERGIVIAAGKHRNMIGRDWSGESWFQAASEGEVHVSDMQFSPEINGHAVYYSAPVRNEAGKVIGVVSTRFNWAYAQEMIDSANFDEDTLVYFMNREGMVIGSTDSLGVLNDSLHWLDAGRKAMKGHCGFTVERTRNGLLASVGFARTKGYNSYRGKKWSGVLVHRLGDLNLPYLQHLVDERSEETPLGSRYLEAGKPIESELANLQLLETAKEIQSQLQVVNANNREVGLLAINASVQSGRAGSDGDSFSVIASHVGRLAKSSLEFVENVNTASKALAQAVESTVLNRLRDAARDAMDKVDRNLFERFCDVQAWTTFRDVLESCRTRRKSESTNELLAKLHKIYEVYHDIFLLDASGNIISTAINRALIGTNQGTRPWFKEAISGRVNFTDVYSSQSVRAPSVAFSAPIIDGGKVIGVLSTRFNCTFLNDILKATIAPSGARVNLVNQKGLTISSLDSEEILNKQLQHLKAFQLLGTTPDGSHVEKDSQDQETYSIGFAHSRGYNTYPGKSWSILIRLKKAK